MPGVSGLHATTLSIVRSVALRLRFTWSTGIGIGAARRGGSGRERDRAAEGPGKLRCREVEVIRRARFSRLSREQRELRIGHLELRTEAATETQGGELEGLVRLARVLLPGLEYGTRAFHLGTRPRDLQPHGFARLLKLDLRDTLLGARQIDVRFRPEAVEQR